MPTYDFKCEYCKSFTETNDPTPSACSLCSNMMVRMYTVPGIAFKGSGFYSTDNRKI